MSALAELGREPASRERLISVLRQIEASFPDKSVNVREVISGPIVDAVFRRNELLKKELAGGLVVFFKYTSKIARDFLMAGDHPDHVWEPQTTKLLLLLAPRTKTAVIAGAYFGDHALLLASALKQTGGRCHCFEINETQIELLKMNAAANGLDNLVPIHKGLWSRSNANLVLVGDDAYASAQEFSGQSPAYQSITLGEFASANGIDDIQILMIDIEGGELQALQGAELYLRQPVERAPKIIFEIHRAYVDWSDGLENTEIVRYLENFGYALYAIRDYHGNVDMRGRPVEIIPIRAVYVDGPPHGFNVLATKEPSIVKTLGLQVVRDVSPKLLLHRDTRLHQPLS